MNQIKKLLASICVIFSLLTMSSCMSIDHIIDPDQRLDIYGGTKKSAKILQGEGSSFEALIALFDFPLTVVMDTLLLPIIAPIAL